MADGRSVMLGGFNGWPYFSLDFEDPFGTFEAFRSLLTMQEPVRTEEARLGVKRLLASIVTHIVEQWEKNHESVSTMSIRLYSHNLTPKEENHFGSSLACPFEAASFAVRSANPVARTRIVDVAELKFALLRFGSG